MKVKWILLLVTMVILYFAGIYLSSFVKLISVFLFLMGCYLMFNPNWVDKTKPEDLNKLQGEFRMLFDPFKDSKLSIERRRVDLLSDFRFRYFGIVSVGCVLVFVICMFIFFLPDFDNQVGFISVVVFLVLFVLNESNRTFFGKTVYHPFSRRERVKAHFFYHTLKNVELTNRELEEGRNEMVEMFTSENETISSGKDVNITMNQYHVVNNNDNRVLNNNFNTIIENKTGEPPSEKQLELNSKFWDYYNLPSEYATNEEKRKHFVQLLDNMNKKHVSLKNFIIFKYEMELGENGSKVNKIAFNNPLNNGSEPIIFAGFVKFLLQEKVISSLIKDISIRNNLLNIFKKGGTEMFKNFQPNRWDGGAVDSYVKHFRKYK